VEPVGRLVGPPGHEQREPRATGRVAHPSQLTLPSIGIVREPGLAVLVALDFASHMLVPMGHASEDNLHPWASR
jgi:hypothetical protein